MKGITCCAECAYYSMKTHKCSIGAKKEPGLRSGEDVRFFVDCPLDDYSPKRGNRMKCRMCDADYFIRVKRIAKTLLMPLTEEQAMFDEIANKFGTECQKIAPRFCPFCGRNLGDEEETE